MDVVWSVAGWLAGRLVLVRPGVTRSYSDLPRQCSVSDMSAWSELHLSGDLRWLHRRLFGPFKRLGP